MYSSSHAAIGTTLVAGGFIAGGTGGLIVGAAVAVVSHLFVDYLGEEPYGDLTTSAIWELIPMLIFAASAFLSGYPMVFLVGWLAGNLMDIIDKKLYLAMFLKNVDPWYFFHKGKPKIKLDLATTKMYAFMSCIVYVTVAIIMKGYA